ncbi:MAG: hypothetical protein Q8Q88_17860 [Phenylobacterium sp.]|uniref:hypothetical protein n=1 Tax=Phenylobacterium sp. TaxID=1871053 RepID=UPI0027327025|nr:hypothetical protein [Phenylobacterium sp.]MDP3748908.1 hypothetical protein [Phenylobacterium sp.]
MRAGLLLSLLLAGAAQAQEPARPMTLDDFLKPEPPAEALPAETPPAEIPPTETAPPEPAKPKTLIEALTAAGFDPRTKVEGASVQVVQGQRALFHLDAKAAPVLDGIDAGKLGAAQPEGQAETYKGSGAGRIGLALDASPAKKQSYMKVWNGLAAPVTFELELAAIRKGQLMRRKVEGCAVPAGGVHSQSWPDPVIAVTVSKVAPAPRDATPCS